MKSRIAFLAVISLLAVFVSKPVHVRAQQPAAPATADMHAHMAAMMDMMSRMKANDAKLDELVAKMNASNGSMKIDAMTQLLTALVEERRTMNMPMMGNMMGMMNMMGGNSGTMMQRTPPK